MRGKDEIATLGGAFNQMVTSLEEEQKRRRMMTADIAHELRTPLSVQRANLEAMLDGIEPKINENIRTVLEQNQLLERLVEDLRTLALVDAGELSLKLSPIDLDKLIINIVESFQQRAKQKNIQLKTEFDKIPQVMNVDQVRVEQILVNLIENSLRYSPQGGKVWVRTINHNHEVWVEVQDTGPGISDDELPYIFERFYRGDSSRSREQGGTGLGLAIARKLAEANGGGLTATNHPEGGAVFRLTLLVENQADSSGGYK